MRHQLAKLLLWLLEKLGYQAFAHGLSKADIERAEVVVAGLDGVGPGGEYRRHQALAKLMKSGMSERDAALAIELAVRRVSP